MKLTVLGGAGAWPPAGGACSGYLIEHGQYRLLVDPGYATLPRLLGLIDAEAVDAVLVSHGHPDHVADLNPLLRARALRDDPAPALPTYALPGALLAVALDRPGMLDDAIDLQRWCRRDPGIGPFRLFRGCCPHRNNIRSVTPADARSPTPATPVNRRPGGLASGTDLLIAEATYVDRVPEDASVPQQRGPRGRAGPRGAPPAVLAPGPGRIRWLRGTPPRVRIRRDRRRAPGLVVDLDP
jgi:hypothetical protein